MLKRVKIWLRNNLGFTKKETNGFLVLLLLMVAFLALALFAPLLVKPYDASTDQQLLDSLVAQIETHQPADAPATTPGNAPVAVLPNQPFDPNALTAAQWQQLGLQKHLAERIIRYQQKGGTFKVKEDVARIYGFPEELYKRLYPFFDLPDRATFLAERGKPRYPARDSGNRYPSGNFGSRPSARRAPLQLFDLNKADTVQLMRIRGIGSKRAQAIVKYRARLGGFFTSQQLSEIYVLDSAVVDSVQKYTFVAPDFTTSKLDINVLPVEVLAKHPYLNFKTARAIVAYREQHGPFKKPEELLKIKLLPPETVQKLRPYLAF